MLSTLVGDVEPLFVIIVLNLQFDRNMLITIKKNTTRQEIEKLLSSLKPRKIFHAKEFLGKIKWGEDALQYQKKIRDEWT